MAKVTTKITVDYEHNCEVWWNAARADNDTMRACPRSCRALLGSPDEVQVSDEDAEEFRAWASKLPGWDEEPFVFNPAELPEPGLYENGIETYYVRADGNVFIVASPDLVGVKAYEEISWLPDDVEKVNGYDVEIPAEIRD